VRRTLLRFVLSVSAAAVVAIVAAIAIAILDLYLVGHGHAGILRDSISWPAAGVHLSIGDIVMLGLALLGAAFVWILFGRRP